jgi:peptide/nickel transport system ATP-binding protein
MLEIQNMTVVYPGRPPFTAVSGVSLSVPEGTTVGLVGESGSGKSTIARGAMRLTPVTHGTVTLDGVDVTNATGRVLAHLRRTAQMVFQDPYASLNPRMEIGTIVQEAAAVALRKPLGSAVTRARARELLEQVGVPRDAVTRFPHQLSGGQLQRVAIARALAVEPRILVLDEVTASLDVSVQARILNLLRRLQRELGISMLYISHDLAVVRYLADHLYVMSRGGLVEHGETESVFADPQQDYTRRLLAAVPRLGGDRWRSRESSTAAAVPAATTTGEWA